MEHLELGEPRLRSTIYVVVAGLFVAGALCLFAALFTFYVWPRSPTAMVTSIVHGHFRAVVGLPMIGAASFVIVLALRATDGPIELHAWGLKFRGAAGPTILWIMLFGAMSAALTVVW